MKKAKIGCFLIVVAFLVTMISVNLTYAPGAVISVNPSTVVASPGDTFTVSIDISSVADCYAWEVEIAWEPELLELVSVTEGPFLASGGSTFFASTVDQIFGEAMFGATLFGPIPGVSGDGVLASVEFLVQEAGKCDLPFLRSELVDSALVDITHSANGGYVSTPQEADLVGRAGWPEHHHYVCSKDEDDYQTLNGKVKVDGPDSLYVKVVFNLVRDDGMVYVVETGVVTVAPGAKVDLTADFGPLAVVDKAKYAVEAHCLYSLGGTIFAGIGDKAKTFSFAVVP